MGYTARRETAFGPGGNGGSRHARDPEAEPKPGPPRCLIVVRRDQPELCEYLRTLAGNGDVEILLDRRRDRTAPDARKVEADRRQPVSMEKDLRYRQYIIVTPQRRVMGM